MGKNNKWSEALVLLADILAKTELEHTIKWGADTYTFNGTNVVAFHGFKDFFSLWFHNGVFMSDPYNVLITASEGKTKSLRQWRFTALEQIDEAKILQYVNEAIEIEKQGLRLAPEKPKAIEIPEELEKAFGTQTGFKDAFSKLSPGKQKEYCEYIASAKQEATRISRLEKCIPLILNGSGLNDKYRKNC